MATIKYARVKRKDIVGQCCHCKYGQSVGYGKKGERHCKQCEDGSNRGWRRARFYL